MPEMVEMFLVGTVQPGSHSSGPVLLLSDVQTCGCFSCVSGQDWRAAGVLSVSFLEAAIGLGASGGPYNLQDRQQPDLGMGKRLEVSPPATWSSDLHHWPQPQCKRNKACCGTQALWSSLCTPALPSPSIHSFLLPRHHSWVWAIRTLGI